MDTSELPAQLHFQAINLCILHQPNTKVQEALASMLLDYGCWRVSFYIIEDIFIACIQRRSTYYRGINLLFVIQGVENKRLC